MVKLWPLINQISWSFCYPAIDTVVGYCIVDFMPVCLRSPYIVANMFFIGVIVQPNGYTMILCAVCYHGSQ